MSDTESEKVNCVEIESSSSAPDTPPPSRSGSDASSVDSLSTSLSELNTTTNEFEATSLSQSTTLCRPCSDSDVSDVDQSFYEKEFQWRHLDQVPDEVSSTHADTSSTQSTDDTLEKKEESDDKEDTDVDDDVDTDVDTDVDDDEEDDEEDEEYKEEEDTEEEESSDTCSENHYVYLVPTSVQTEYPPLLTFLFFLFLFLHLMHYMLLLKDSQNNKCFPFRH